jgi:hypothetical protein
VYVAHQHDGGGDQLEVGLFEQDLLQAAAELADEAFFDDLFAHHSFLDGYDVHGYYWIIQFEY